MRKKTKALQQSRTFHCDLCDQKKCKGDTDCFQIAPLVLSSYVNDQLHLAKASSKIEGTYYLKKTRLEEIILFSQEMGYKKLGVAFCIGLAEEAKILSIYLRNYFQVV
jgi:uncharacterized metal-binding protein